MDGVWIVVTDAAAVVTLVTLPYLLINARRRVPRFSFTMQARSREPFSRDGLDYALVRTQGILRNQSLDANSIVNIFYIVWRDGRRAARSFGGIPSSITEDGKIVSLPLALGPREARTLVIEHEVVLTGSHDLGLMSATEAVPGSPGYVTAKYTYELAFEDVLGNLFDESGALRNRRGIDLRWTLANALDAAKEGHFRPLLKHLALIYVRDLVFSLRRAIRRLGF